MIDPIRLLNWRCVTVNPLTAVSISKNAPKNDSFVVAGYCGSAREREMQAISLSLCRLRGQASEKTEEENTAKHKKTTKFSLGDWGSS